jgi:hypothetical protein
MEVLAALSILPKISSQQVVLAVKDIVDQLMSHQNEVIRKKCVIVMMKFNSVYPIDGFD